MGQHYVVALRCGRAIPVGDALYGLGIIVFGGISIYTASNFSFEVDLPKEHSSPCEVEEETEVPEVTYPGDDPAEAPEGYEWRGNGQQGSSKGGYANSGDGKDSCNPDWIMAVTLVRIGITMMDTVTSGVFSRITELIL